MNDHPAATFKPELRPLYVQIQGLITKRIADGAWKPGDLLPTEHELAAEYGVSQGTVRKALIALEGEKLIVRRQGVGTTSPGTRATPCCSASSASSRRRARGSPRRAG